MNGNIALLIIDVQTSILAVPMKNEQEVTEKFADVITRISQLLSKARSSSTPVIYVQHDGAPGHRLEKGSPGWEIHPAIAPKPDELVVNKQFCDSFFETTLQEELGQRGIQHLVVAGCMTQYCIDTTCRRAVSLGYDVTLAGDAHTTSDNDALNVHQIVAHHNRLLDDFDAGAHRITIKQSGEIDFL